MKSAIYTLEPVNWQIKAQLLSVQMHLEGIVALLNSEMKTLFVETLKRLHGEVCLDEIYSLFSSIQFNNGTIGKDSKIILNPHHQSFDNGTR